MDCSYASEISENSSDACVLCTALMGGWLSNSPPPPPWGRDNSGYLGLPNSGWVGQQGRRYPGGGAPLSPPPPAFIHTHVDDSPNPQVSGCHLPHVNRWWTNANLNPPPPCAPCCTRSTADPETASIGPGQTPEGRVQEGGDEQGGEGRAEFC